MAKRVEKVNQVKKKIKKPFFEKYRFDLIIFIFSTVLYFNSIPNGYNMDDELVTINHRLTSKGISAIPEIFSTTYYKDNMGYAYEYRPMVLTSFAIEHSIFGDNPVISHLINVLLYGLCCLLLLRVLMFVTYGFSIFIPLSIVLLFAAHPAHTEVVCSIKNRDEILGLIFSFLTWICAFKAVNVSSKWLIGVPLFFIAALMSKMSVMSFAVIIPAAIILFTGASYKKIFSIALLLVISSFVIMNNGLYNKLVITAGMMAVTLMLFVFIRFNQFTAALNTFWKSVFTKLSSDIPDRNKNFVLGSLKGFFSGIFFDFRNYLSPQSIAITFIAAAIYLTGVMMVFPVLVVIGGIIFFILLVFGNEKTQWWGNVLLYTCLVITEIKYPVGDSIFADLLAACLGYQVLYGDRRLFIACLPLMVAIHFLGPMTDTMAFAAFRWKWTWPVTIVLIFSAIHSDYQEIAHTGYLFNYAMVISVALIISLLVGRGTKNLIKIFQFSAIASLFMLHVFTKPITPAAARLDLKTGILKIGKEVNTNIISEKSDRPLNFVEQPVTYKSPFQVRAGTAFEIMFTYLHKVIVPYPMSFYYGYRFIEPENITDAIPLTGLLLYTALFLLAGFCLKRSKLIGFGLLVYLISIASVSTYFFPIPGQIGERFLFIPSLGWSIVFVAGLSLLFKPNIKPGERSIANLPKGFRYSIAAVLCLYSVMTFSRNFDWKDYTTLSKHDIAYVSNSSQANNLVALNLMKSSYQIQDPAAQKAMRIEALGHFKKALEIYPGFYNVTYDIARVYNVLNENDSSIFYFKKAFALDSTNPDPALFMGQMLVTQGKFAEAIPYLQYVIAHHAADYQPFDRLSFAYFKLQDYQKSIAVNQSAISMLPPQTGPYINIAHVYLSLNQTDSARTYLQKAARINPNDPNIHQMQQQIESKK